MKRMILQLGALLMVLMTSQAHAQFYAGSPEGVLPPNMTPFQYYIQQQVNFMDHLRTCRTFTMKVRSPTQPNLLIVKEIFGQRRGYCQTQTITYPANRQKFGLEPVVRHCQLTEKDIKTLTSSYEFTYVKTLAENNAHLYTYSNLTPAREKLHKSACKIVSNRRRFS